MNGVHVINMPHDRDDIDAYYAYYFLKIADRFTKNIPVKLRSAVTLDFNKVPDDEFVEWDKIQRKPPSEAELKLIAALEELEKNGWKLKDNEEYKGMKSKNA
ncbi:MAG: hypothetical protein BSOLF_2915 [Candidatus Carbobacillus altaicus]|uniref:Uncharacterized protein n=1 Tax=Candidatus Carbonibacillus altaicus TaxID=2163959 RepID=A0A2R6XXR7_9BACL|nr:MAG: hypothetical protein BSOLF_2915 [Candidatus Carbobacillus altaicus]